jgi:hypothetical protein
MPKSSPAKLAYMAEYQKQPARIKAREEANKARYHALKDGKVHKGDGKDVAHIVALDSGGKTVKGNTKIESEKANRDWRKGRSSYKVPVDK